MLATTMWFVADGGQWCDNVVIASIVSSVVDVHDQNISNGRQSTTPQWLTRPACHWLPTVINAAIHTTLMKAHILCILALSCTTGLKQ